MEHGSLKRGLLTIPKREVHGNTIYDATSTLSVTVYFDAIRLDIHTFLQDLTSMSGDFGLLIDFIFNSWLKCR
jgi:hypothetical protein